MVTLHFVLFPELLYLKQRIDEATPNKKPVQTSVGMRRFQISLSLTHTHTYTRVRANSDDDLQRTQKHLSFVDRSCAKKSPRSSSCRNLSRTISELWSTWRYNVIKEKRKGRRMKRTRGEKERRMNLRWEFLEEESLSTLHDPRISCHCSASSIVIEDSR